MIELKCLGCEFSLTDTTKDWSRMFSHKEQTGHHFSVIDDDAIQKFREKYQPKDFAEKDDNMDYLKS